MTTLWEGDALRSMGAGVRAKKFAFMPVKVHALCLSAAPACPLTTFTTPATERSALVPRESAFTRPE